MVGVVADVADSMGIGAVGTAVDLLVCQDPVPDHGAATVRTPRRHTVDRAFEAVECVARILGRDQCERRLIGVAADIAGPHGSASLVGSASSSCPTRFGFPHTSSDQACVRRRDVGTIATRRYTMDLILWIIAAVLVISGIVTLIRGGLLWGIVLIVVGLLVGPGGVSVFT